jgi:hypothetical protein
MLVEAVAALEMSAAPKATAALAAAVPVVLVQVRLTGLEPQEQLIRAVVVAAVAVKPASALVQAVQAALALSFSAFQLQVTAGQQLARPP